MSSEATSTLVVTKSWKSVKLRTPCTTSQSAIYCWKLNFTATCRIKSLACVSSSAVGASMAAKVAMLPLLSWWTPVNWLLLPM